MAKRKINPVVKWYKRKQFYIPTAIIVAIIVTSPKWIELFSNKSVEPAKAATSIKATANDSSTQNIAIDNSTTTNQNEGDVVKGNKVVNNTIVSTPKIRTV